MTDSGPRNYLFRFFAKGTPTLVLPEIASRRECTGNLRRMGCVIR